MIGMHVAALDGLLEDSAITNAIGWDRYANKHGSVNSS